MTQTQVAAPLVRAENGQRMDVRFVAGEAYEVAVRGHRVLVDQPADAGGQDSAPTPPAGLPPQRWMALQAVVSHCTVHNSLVSPPPVTIDMQ